MSSSSSSSSSSNPSSPLAIFRLISQRDADLARLAAEHASHDLEPSDCEALVKASTRVVPPTIVGSLVGLGFGVYAAFRLRRLRADMFSAFKAAKKPTHVVFRGGRKEAIPDATRYIRPTKFGDWATYFFFGLGGTVLGGELGLLLGTWSASRVICQDEARRKRVEKAYRRYKADYLRREAEKLEKGEDDGESVLF